jgi:hypothetical protein
MAGQRARNFKCDRCSTAFESNRNLQRHLARKKPCDPILDTDALSSGEQANPNRCRYCGRGYSRSDNLARHLKTCKIANSEEGMERLMEHTLRRQLATQNQEMQAIKAQVAELTALLREQLVVAPGLQGATPAIRNVAMVNTGQVTTVNNQQINQVIQINPWDGERRITVDVADVVAAFAGNARLRQYAQMGDHELTDPEIAPPYVTELLMDLTKRAHADPAARNVYLNPRRADQALVHLRSGRWEVVSLAEATRLLFDGVAKGILSISRVYEERRQLPSEAQNALALAGLLYDEEPDEYVKRAKAPMTAHLENCRDRAPALGQKPAAP